MGLFGSLFGVNKMNADPDQQKFAQLFIAAAESGSQRDLVQWLVRQPWSPSETRTRIAHALSIVKVASVPETFAKAKEIGLQLHNASYNL